VAEAAVLGAAATPWLSVYANPPWVLHLAGELDLASAPAVTRMLEKLARHTDRIGLDLAEVSFIDSTGVRTLCDAARLVGDRGRVTVFRPSTAARRIIELSGLVGTIDISDDDPLINRSWN
jgi:anti-anti-sigma factor